MIDFSVFQSSVGFSQLQMCHHTSFRSYLDTSERDITKLATVPLSKVVFNVQKVKGFRRSSERERKSGRDVGRDRRKQESGGVGKRGGRQERKQEFREMVRDNCCFLRLRFSSENLSYAQSVYQKIGPKTKGGRQMHNFWINLPSTPTFVPTPKGNNHPVSCIILPTTTPLYN